MENLRSNENLEPKKESTKIREDFLNQNIDTLSPKDLAKYLITLIQERDSLFKNNTEKFPSITDKLKQIYGRYSALEKSGTLSPETKDILSQIKTTVESMNTGNIEKTRYEKLQYELTEAQIDEATSDMDRVLNHDATIITIGVGKYEQA